MKAFAVVGFKDSGKTSLAEKLVGILVKRGYRVAAVKHAHGGLTLQGDSARLLAAGAEHVLAISDNVSETIESREVSLWEALTRLRSYDFVVVEGFKERFPGVRVAVVRNGEELARLRTPLLVAAYVRSGPRLRETDLPVFGPGEEEKLVDLLVEKAFEPPAGLDCGLCGYRNCLELAEAVVRGEVSATGCRVLSSKVELRVNGRVVGLNPFVQELVKNVVKGIVSSLKGVPERPARVELFLSE